MSRLHRALFGGLVAGILGFSGAANAAPVGSHPGTWQPERPLRSSDTAAAVAVSEAVAFVAAGAVLEAGVAFVAAAVVSVVAVAFVVAAAAFIASEAAVVAASTTSVAAVATFIASTAVHICLVAR